MKKFIKIFLAACLLTVFALDVHAQSVGINATGDAPNGSAMLDVSSTSKGFLAPRMTTVEIRAIANPADGLQVYSTTDGKLYIFVASVRLWKEVSFGTGVLVPPFTNCGDALPINHLASGGVAPVDKTVNYGTVTNIPGLTSKCWITSNLGADHQATAVDDATEASAGWYWQFNRKQGYKHDGTTRTPNTAWVSSINETSDWTAANDPCTLELGSGWRIPTRTEWNSVDAIGNWNTWTGPWTSNLKMHAAGYLSSSDGSLTNRGSGGYYWSSSQSNATNGWYLYFSSGYGFMDVNYKAFGFSLRCLRD